MSHDDSDTPPERDVLGYLVRMSSEIGEVRVLSERHAVHISNLRQDVMDFRDEVRAVAPRIEDHTGRIRKLEGAARAAAGRMSRWQGIAIGIAAGIGFSGGLVAALAAMGVFK